MNQNNNQFAVGMSAFGAIFFIFGFATTFIITLSAPVKGIFGLSETAAQLLSSAFFIAYPIMSIPTGKLINVIGYKKTVISGLVLMAIGSLLFLPAAKLPSFPFFLLATFILAIGVVFLQVSANPYVTALGAESSASSRLNLTQALNSIATMIAPWLISVAVFKGLDLGAVDADVLKANQMEAASRVPMPFIMMATVVLAVAVILFIIKLPAITSGAKAAKKSVWKYPHVVLGAIGIFCYVGAEVGNAGLLVNYLKKSSADITSEVASTYAAIYWGGAMVGRFFGSIMFSDIKDKMRKYSLIAGVLVLGFFAGSFVTDWNWNIGFIFVAIAFVNFLIMQFGTGKAARTLAIFALAAALLDIVTSFTTGNVALWSVVSIGLFNSIMFPNIFSLAVKDLDGEEMASASGIINALIIGGAIIPPLMGMVADKFAYSLAFIIPALCYLYIFFFAVKGSKIRTA
ncbi:FHS family L-fucose permease-like MFS transporter [Breznakibacter xylanolyticus]|uniref:FHS family L-fucose permease-like MFS transporter n=1 Tax=Breznakibacter xylanolyticus TaxID=990 RepID=A0A2W7P9N6_9BACT|nr:MFS transporter [Breznakibacter xylanolyticus]PZX20062.1 FHS family L-fucose permease-like MFS transporter [Breznakibacter xylanolyticus]